MFLMVDVDIIGVAAADVVGRRRLLPCSSALQGVVDLIDSEDGRQPVLSYSSFPQLTYFCVLMVVLPVRLAKLELCRENGRGRGLESSYGG